MSINNIVHVDSGSVLLSKYMNASSILNSNLFRNDFPTDNLYDGRIIFLKVHESADDSGDEQ